MNKMLTVFLMFLCFSTPVLSQTNPQNYLSYTAPPGWTSTRQTGVTQITAPAGNNGAFCLITIYDPVSGTNNNQTDFNKSWKELVTDRLKVNQKPSPQKGEPENGWDNLTGTAEFSIQGQKATAVLTTLSGYKLTQNILVVTNDPDRKTELENFYNSLKMAKPGASPAQQPVASGSVGFYQFTVPPGWTKETNPAEIVLRASDKNSVLSLLPLQTSTGNLSNDLETAFQRVFDGWFPDPANPDHHIITTGVSTAGWSYIKKEIGIAKDVNGQRMHTVGILMLCDLGGQEAVIAGSYPGGNYRLNPVLYTDWIQFFHSLTFSNYKNSGYSLSKDILGSWLTGSGTTLATYTFFANGHFDDGSAFKQVHSYSEYQVLEKTVSIAGSGTYTLNGNQLILHHDNGRNETCLVRVYYENEFGTPLRKIGLLKKTVSEGNLYELTMVTQPISK